MKYIYLGTIVSFSIFVAVLTACLPGFLATNTFLTNFLNNQLLNILGVITSVTLASAANIHLTFNRIEEETEQFGVFSGAKKEIKNSSILLLVLFIISVLFLVIRSLSNELTWLSGWNGALLIILILNVFVLLDITEAIFEISPIKK